MSNIFDLLGKELIGYEWDSLAATLSPGTTVWDVGAHDGESSIFLAEIVGPANVVIIEPGLENWARIKWSWEKYYTETPLATFAGFCADANSERREVNRRSWPRGISYDKIYKSGDGPFGSLAERTDVSIPRLTIDVIANLIGAPGALAIDVEGAELITLRGAEKTLREKHPMIWASLHWFSKERYGHSQEDIHAFMTGLGYTGKLLGKDHEEHWLFI